MRPFFYWEPVDWKSRGYFVPSSSADDPDLKADESSSLWLEVQGILTQAKAGDFNRIARLLDIHAATRSHLLRWACAQILGDAGTAFCLNRMVLELDDTLDPDRAGDFCHAFEAWGSLSAIPAFLKSYDRYFGFQSMDALPLMLSTILEMEWGPLSDFPTEDELLAYEDRVVEQYEELKQKFGTDDVILLHGERFGVVSLARRMLRSLGDSHFERAMQPFYRRRFEASTGIDCSGFYKDREFQPLTAAAILEGFLESPRAARYEEGVRYFFGHPIPE
ncbi:hypothetical protein JQX13_40560 [Archangium violaceum]|uniref:hypothetical protein n=1 Tax=Archangium violaceum TaxID=83451 RepID=UPI00193C7DAD|nr:hypothetical protein [Archangium violaceum]QRK06338.1 hypothetical protein JQX13_40560 [Archangium violaceum]